LNEERGIWVHLPDDYNTSTQTYPVLYLLDGDGHFNEASSITDYLSGYERNRMPQMIVVAILNVDRTRDFTPIHSLIFAGKVDSARMATTGGGARFLQFIQQELVPHIDSAYRTQPYRILAAHSLGGLFGLYAKEEAPNLFQSTILMSPAFYGGNNKIFTDFTPFLKRHPNLLGKMFITIGDEDMQKVDSLQLQLKTSAPKNFTWGFAQYKQENHFSVTYKSLYDGLRFIYKNWFIDYYGSAQMWYKDLQLHFSKLSQEFGYDIQPGEELVNNCGYTQLRAGHIDCAIDIFKQNTIRFPHSWNAFDSLGEAYAAKGDKENAIINYKISLQLNPSNDDGKEALKKLGVTAP
jgi:predicted alpha/beta superfamily hydrolase